MNRRVIRHGTVWGILFFALLVSGAISIQAQEKTVILATTTSTQDSGLLDVLIPVFEKQTGYFVKTIAVGSGQAMAMGEKGEADVLLVHSPAAEKKFVAEGYGINRRIIMHNDFVVVGPPEDPAKVKGMKSTSEAFKGIAAGNALFLSRADKSGTHVKEMDIWKAAGIKSEGEKWYQQTGLGMGQTLSVANEKKGYTLADRGTYLCGEEESPDGHLGGGRRHSSQYLPCHRGQPSQVAQGQRSRR